MRALAIAATGMNAQQHNLEVIANNIANINTTAFKRARAEFTDLMYQAERLPGVSNRGRDSTVPEGAYIGLGVRTAAIRHLHIQGALSNTGNKLDLALNGRGWLQITGADGETLYTRAGALNTNANGQIVTSDGYALIPAMNVPANTIDLSVNETGMVSALVSGQTAPQQIGQITLANFANEAGLEPLGGNLSTWRQSLQANVGLGPAGHGRSRRHGVRHDSAGVSRIVQCRPGEGDHRDDRGAARLRDELQGHHRRRRNGEHDRARRAVIRLLAALVALVGASAAMAQQMLPSPAMVIYPGDIISDPMLVDVDSRDLARGGGPAIEKRAELIGKAARRTLLPGAAISPAFVESPRAVANGASVRVIYQDGGLTIAASASAMQSGAVGDTVKLRSADSGLTITGVIQPDGSVRVRDR